MGLPLDPLASSVFFDFFLYFIAGVLEELPKAVPVDHGCNLIAAALHTSPCTVMVTWFIQGRYDVDLERRVLRQIWFLNLERQILLISSWHHLASAVFCCA